MARLRGPVQEIKEFCYLLIRPIYVVSLVRKQLFKRSEMLHTFQETAYISRQAIIHFHFVVLAEEFRAGYLGDSVHCCGMN